MPPNQLPIESEHTPGPWRVSRCVLGELQPFCTNDNHLLSSVGALAIEEREANARLIAAAPDLLEMLKEISRPGSVSTSEFHRKGGFQERASALIRQISAPATRQDAIAS
jgi:hypothetical protein